MRSYKINKEGKQGKKFDLNLSEIAESPNAVLFVDDLVEKVNKKREKDTNEKDQAKVLNDMFLSTLGDDEIV